MDEAPRPSGQSILAFSVNLFESILQRPLLEVDNNFTQWFERLSHWSWCKRNVSSSKWCRGSFWVPSAVWAYRCTEKAGLAFSIASVRRGMLLVNWGFGLSSRKNGTPCKPTSVYRYVSASRTKKIRKSTSTNISNSIRTWWKNTTLGIRMMWRDELI